MNVPRVWQWITVDNSLAGAHDLVHNVCRLGEGDVPILGKSLPHFGEVASPFGGRRFPASGDLHISHEMF